MTNHPNRPRPPAEIKSADSALKSGGSLHVIAGSVLSYFYNAWIGRLPSRHLRRFYLRAYLGAFGKGSTVQLGARFLNGRKVRIGERNIINFGTLIDGRRFPVETGSDVSIGPEATILTLGHDPQSSAFEDLGGPVRIGSRAWIAYRAIILPGVTIGEGAVVAAGAVVSRDVEPFTIVAGSPARAVGMRNKDLGYRLDFDPFLL